MKNTRRPEANTGRLNLDTGLVASEDNKGFLIKKGFWVSDTLTVNPIGLEPKLFEFRGGDKAHQAHNIIMEYLLE